MKCDRCENPPAYTRKYSGEKLCSQCFSKSIVKKTAKTISKYKMIKHNELVAVAVSGGKDSHFQTYLLKEKLDMNPVLLTSGNIDWTISAGTNENDSEWIVLNQDDWMYLGYHEVSCVVSGCIDENAFNYDEEATEDDGSCVPFIDGCTDELLSLIHI